MANERAAVSKRSSLRGKGRSRARPAELPGDWSAVARWSPAPRWRLLVPSLSSSASVGDVIAHAIAEGAERLVGGEGRLHAGVPDTVAVHQARVATRRLRSDLRTFRGVLDREWVESLRRELAWLAGVLGAARDADVLLERLTLASERLPAASGQAAQEILADLTERQNAAYLTLLGALGGERYLELVERLIDAAGAPRLRAARAARPAVEVLPRLLAGAWRTVERAVESLPPEPAAEELHRVRIAAKRCRYAAEACTPPLGSPTRRLARAAKQLQDVLGELNDAEVTERWLREWVQQSSSASCAFVAGELAVLQAAPASEAKTRWRKAWRRLAIAATATG